MEASIWKKILPVSLLVTTILALSGYIWHGLDAQVKENLKEIKVVKEKKVDNETLQQAIRNSEKLNELRHHEQEIRQEKVDKHLDRLYQELLKRHEPQK